MVADRDEARPVERDPDADLAPSDRLVLVVLRAAGGTLAIAELREQTGLHERTVRQSVARMQSDGIVERERHPDDPRRRRVRLVSWNAAPDRNGG